MAERRIETKSSQTADYTCFSRGCATREKDPRFRGPDTMAELLFPTKARLMLDIAPVRKFIMRRMFPPGLHEYVFVRTKVMDSAFMEALDAHFSQIILLGAGFDTRAMRFADRNPGTKILEMDAPTTQQAKVGVLRRKMIPLPEDLIFAPINFNREEIANALAHAGYQTG